MEIQQMANKKIEEIELKIRDLNKVKIALEELTGKCPGKGHPINDCPIINSLDKDLK